MAGCLVRQHQALEVQQALNSLVPEIIGRVFTIKKAQKPRKTLIFLGFLVSEMLI